MWKKIKYVHPDYVSQYTEEEHRERILARAKEKYVRQFTYFNATYEVYTIYAFYDNDPKYFLVEIFLEDELGNTDYAHMLGFIENDRYYGGLLGYGDGKHAIIGKSFWATNNVLNLKKYYGGGINAYEIDGVIYGAEVNADEDEKLYEIPKSKHEYLMKSNLKLFGAWPF